MKTCHCNICPFCEAKRAVLKLGASRQWEAYQLSPCAWIAEKERHWRTFTDTHSEPELRAVLAGEYHPPKEPSIIP